MSWSDSGPPPRCGRRALLAAAVAALAGCTVRPLYGPAAGAEAPRRVALGGVGGREGYLFREALARRFALDPEARDQLDVTLSLNTVGLAISRIGDITRVNVEGFARYRLTDRAGERAPIEGTVRAVSGYSTLASAYATRVAADDAVARVAAELAERVFTQVAVRSAAAA